MRSTEEWIGKTDDSAIPERVRVRVFKEYRGICPKCTRKMQPHKWQCDHIVALINGGQNRESNLQPLCKSPCHSQKTKQDVAEKSRVYQRAASHIGASDKRSRLQSQGFRKPPPQHTATRPIRRASEIGKKLCAPH